MSDPQNDEYIEVETNDSTPASEPGEQVQAESNVQVDEVAEAKQKANDAFNKQYGEKKQLERDLQLERQKLATFEQAERDRVAAQVGDIPPIPDPFDDDVEAKTRARDEAIRANERHSAQQNAYLQQQQRTQQQAAQAKQEQVNKSMQDYTSKAVELGIKQEELQAAGNTVAGYGLSDDLVMHILADSDGPLITKHLAANPQEGYQLASMSPFAVGSFLDGIKAKASALKPKTTNAPAPATGLQGSGGDPDASKYKNLRGTKYD